MQAPLTIPSWSLPSYLFSYSCKHLCAAAPPLPQWWWREPAWPSGRFPSSHSSCPSAKRPRRLVCPVSYSVASPPLLLSLQPAANPASPSPSCAAAGRHRWVLRDGRVSPESRLLSRKEGGQERRTTAPSYARAWLLCDRGGGAQPAEVRATASKKKKKKSKSIRSERALKSTNSQPGSTTAVRHRRSDGDSVWRSELPQSGLKKEDLIHQTGEAKSWKDCSPPPSLPSRRRGCRPPPLVKLARVFFNKCKCEQTRRCWPNSIDRKD